jgi:D-sedoheptulose 7-phosphate isomerase
VKLSTIKGVNNLIQRYSALEICKAELDETLGIFCTCYATHHKMLVCGNGGSAADSEHIVGELMKGFILPRKLKKSMKEKLQVMFPDDVTYFMENLQGTLPAISLVNQIALNTAFSNDQAPDLCFAQQVLAMGEVDDVFLGISTSGNATNVIYAAKIAKIKGLKVIALTGANGGELKDIADICIKVPETETYKVQEYHLPIYHMFCAAVENEIFGKF